MASPIIDRTPIDGLYFNGGWCYGSLSNAGLGMVFAHLLTTTPA